MTKTIFHTADTHIELGKRWNECTRILDEFAARVEQDSPDLVVHAGDVFHRRSSPLEMQFAERWIQRLAHVCPVIIVRGNHDAQHEIEGFRRLRAPHPIWSCEEPQIITVAGIAIAALPWPSKAGVVQQATDLSLEATSDEAIVHLRNILRWAKMELDEAVDFDGGHLPTMLLTHAMVRGSRTAAGQPLVGCDFELTPDDLDIADAVALGHIHQAQSFTEGLIRYAGSPFHTDFGDGGQKSFSKWTVDNDGYWTCEPVPLSAHEMVEVHAQWDADEGRLVNVLELDAANRSVEVKLTYSCAPEHATAAREQARILRDLWLRDGAYSVELNPITLVATRARAPEVASAVTDDAKLQAHWDAKGDVPPTLRSNLLEKFHQLQGES